jgi:hypothetical protein
MYTILIPFFNKYLNERKNIYANFLIL